MMLCPCDELSIVDWCGARLVCKDTPKRCNASDSWSDPPAAEGLLVDDVYSAGMGQMDTSHLQGMGWGNGFHHITQNSLSYM